MKEKTKSLILFTSHSSSSPQSTATMATTAEKRKELYPNGGWPQAFNIANAGTVTVEQIGAFVLF